jgi:hypothetical protein
MFSKLTLAAGAAVATTMALVASSSPAQAFVYFAPAGSDIVTTVGATQSFDLFANFTGVSTVPASINFLANWDASELGFSSFVGGLTTTASGSATNSRNITVTGFSSPGSGPFLLGQFKFNVLSGLNNDGAADFETSLALNQVFPGLPGDVFATSGVEVVPTPALLPGLLGLGVAALRRKQDDSVEENV